MLKNETDFAISYCSQVIRTKVGSLDPVDPALPARRPIQAPDYSHEGRFAGSDGPVIATYSPASIDTVTPSSAVTF